MAQAEERATGDFNHGVWWAKTAVEMAQLRNLQLGKVLLSSCFSSLPFFFSPSLFATLLSSSLLFPLATCRQST